MIVWYFLRALLRRIMHGPPYVEPPLYDPYAARREQRELEAMERKYGPCTTGNRNIAIGYNALARVCTGNENVCIGYPAGRAFMGFDPPQPPPRPVVEKQLEEVRWP